MTALPAEALRACCDPATLPFATTAELAAPAAPLGQGRAQQALRLAMGMRGPGYNVMVSGAPGLGRHDLVMHMLRTEAAGRPVPDDWCYVYNFREPHRPVALRLPPGRGRALQMAMRQATDELRTALPAIFESDEYRNRREEIDIEFNERESSAMQVLADEARGQGIALLRTPSGFGLAPVKDDEVISPDDFEKLPEAEQAHLRAALATLHDKLHRTLRQMPQWGRERHRRLRELAREFTVLAVEHILGEVRQAFAEVPAVLSFVDAVQADLVENTENLRPAPESPGGGATPALDPAAFARYQVNVLVDHGDGADGAGPVVYLDQPSHANLVGRVEHLERMGMLVTDFSLIKAGALQRANGGFLVLDARRVLTQPLAWESLKRALFSASVRPESLAQVMSLVSTISLEPEPIPLEVKVVLVGEPPLYELLHAWDPDFPKLFKVLADFDDRVPRTAENTLAFAATLGEMATRNGTLPLTRETVARLVEHAARLAGDGQRLSVHLEPIADLLREADREARLRGCAHVDPAAIQTALDQARVRSGRLREHLQEAILREVLRVDTTGERIGQVNGLSVIDLGHTAFAHPTRVTATVRLGDGEVVDIQREVELGGSIHSKGVLILSAFLATRYASNMPLSLSASLSFEQTYAEVDGDSASMAELCVLLSALADLPIRQSLAITGSVDQFGHAQAIGAVNEKIEGFFDICRERGLSGDQGVLIPAANLPHLMLRDEVVEACRAGRFAVHAVRDVDEAIALLTGADAGLPDDKGLVPPGSVNYLVGARLLEFSTLHQSFSGRPGGGRKAKKAT